MPYVVATKFEFVSYYIESQSTVMPYWALYIFLNKCFGSLIA